MPERFSIMSLLGGLSVCKSCRYFLVLTVHCTVIMTKNRDKITTVNQYVYLQNIILGLGQDDEGKPLGGVIQRRV